MWGCDGTAGEERIRNADFYDDHDLDGFFVPDKIPI